MSDFATDCQGVTGLDPYKRVNYVDGLVLGVDEFVQEQVYHLAKNRLHNRTLHGYGTVCGLEVRQRDTPRGPEIVVAPGIAVNPRGQEIRLPQAHCALLADWLTRNSSQVTDALGGSPPADGPLSLYLTLCYRECKTDAVPIPSGPCQTLEDSSVASRIQDAFELVLAFEPPEQQEEQGVRELVALLCAIPLEEAPGGLTEAEMIQLVRGLIPTGSPPEDSPPVGSPPVGGSPLHMHPADAPALLTVAWRTWITWVRPRLLPQGRNCAEGPPQEGCVLLARLDLDIAFNGNDPLPAGPVTIDQDDRPLLLHGRLLQEWLLCLAGRPHAQQQQPVIDQHGDLLGLGDDDHPQYLLADGSRPLSGDLGAGGNRITDLAPGTVAGEAVPFEQAVKVNDPAGGDLGDSYPNPRVQGLQNRTVAPTAPQNGQVLTWSAPASRWEPRALPAAPPGPGGDFVQIPPIDIPYAIVAAGMFGGNGQPLAPSFNSLRVLVMSDGDYLLVFPGYRRPPANPTPADVLYIVKGTCGIERETGLPCLLQFIAFEDEGIRVRLVSIRNLRTDTTLMVEISAYGRLELG